MSNKSNGPRRTPSRKGNARGRGNRSLAKDAAPPSADLGLLPRLLGYQLRLAQRAIFADFVDSVGDGAMSPGLFGILVIIEANAGLKQTELAVAAQLDRSSIVPVVDKLEARGLVERRASSEDRRVNGLWLTAAGADVLTSLKRQVARHEQRVAERLSPEEREQLVRLLQKIHYAA